MAGIQELKVSVFDADGNEEEAGLSYTTNALNFIEEATGKSVEELGALFDEGKIGTFLMLIQAGLEGWRMRRNRKRVAFTKQDAGDAFDSLGGLSGGGVASLMEFFHRAFPDMAPDPKDGKSGDTTENPT